MANFLDSTADAKNRLGEYSERIFRIEAHIRRGERRAARKRLDGFLQELEDFANEMELPVETVVVGAQLGFFSGGSLLRGRLPGALVGATAGWLFGQSVIQQQRLFLYEIIDRVVQLYEVLNELDRQALESAQASS